MVTIIVNDGRGGQVGQPISMPVNEAANHPPLITSMPTFASLVDNLYQYQIIASDQDGDEISFALETKPNGMLLDNNGLIEWTPSAAQASQVFDVKIVAMDSRGSQSSQTYSIAVNQNAEANNAPQIVSSPTIPAIVDQTYNYQVIAQDSDADQLTYSLEQAPEGMLINQSGLLSWTASLPQLGEHPISIRVSDGLAYMTQSYILPVIEFDGSNNQYPEIISQPRLNAVAEINYQYQLIATDPDGDSLSYELVNGPEGMSMDLTGLINWTSSQIQLGSHSVQVKVSDGRLSALQNYTLTVTDEALPLSLSVTISPKIIDAGGTTQITLFTDGGNGEVSRQLFVDGQSVALDVFGKAQLSSDIAGQHNVFVKATTETEEKTFDGFFTVRDTSDTTAPVVIIHSPTDDLVVTAPIDIVATITDENLANYWVGIVPVGNGGTIDRESIQMISQGSETVENAVIAQLDPTLLINGQYRLIIEATDVNGEANNMQAVVQVSGDLKVGNFTITLEDLNIPMAGIPVRITRTYDSRRRNEKLDFGYGWSIGYQDVKVEESRTQGKFWSLNKYPSGPLGLIPLWCVEPQGAPVVTVTLPTGDVETFETAASPRCSQVYPFLDVQLVYNAVGDTQSTLKAINDNSARLNVSANTLVETDFFSYPVDPSLYTLTTRSGYIYHLDQNFGVTKVEDPNGHTLTYTNEGIFHSAGKSILFNRDSEGKIVDVTAPDGRIVNYTFDAQNNLQSSIDPLLAETQYTYNRNHGLLEIIDPLGRTIVKNIYNDAGRLIAQEDNAGNRTSFDHDLAGRQSIVTDRLNRTTTLYYDDQGNVTSQVDALGNVTSFTFDSNGNQLSKTDALNRLTSATYNARNDQLTQTDALGNTVSFTYNDRGQELTITDESGDVFTNTYDTVGNLLSIKDPQGNVIGNNINAQGLPSLVRDAMGNETTYTYDSDGNKLTEKNALNETISFTYDDNANVLTETRTRTLADDSVVNEVTAYEYDKQNRVIKTTDVLGNVFINEYDLVGNQIATIDALNRRTEMDYDVYDRLIETRYPDGTSSSKTYDAEGNVLTETDVLGHITSYSYDALNRVTKTTLADGSFTQTEYDAVGQVTANIDALGNRTTHEYDLNGRRTKTTDALFNSHSFAYDKDGNLTSETDALNHTTTYVYDALDRKIQTTFHNSSSVKTGFDKLARKTSNTDQANVVTNYAYDALGRLTSVTDVQGNVTSYTYDEAGNKITQTDAEGRKTSWTYDALGRVLTRTLPLGQVEIFTYDAAGNMLTHIDFDGQATINTYDQNDRLLTATYHDGASLTYIYTASGQVLSLTKTDVDNNSQITSYIYDSRDRLVKEIKSNGEIIEYTYDLGGNRTELVLKDGASVSITSYVFDALNRLTQVTKPNGEVTSYTYDAGSNLIGENLQSGNHVEYIYSDVKQLTDVIHRDSADNITLQFNYTLDATGRRTRIEENNGRVSEFEYDNLYRLIGETITDAVNGNRTSVFEYDKVGNRKSITVDGVQILSSYDENDRLTQQGDIIYSYDNNGNTLTETLDDNITTYNYTAKNELISVDKNGITTQYGYNANGIRTSKTQEGITTSYLVDENRPYAQVLKESDGSNETFYTYGLDLLSQKKNGAQSYYHYDALGSTRALSDSTGNITDTYDYAADGVTLNQTGTSENSYLFSGEQRDSETGNYYLRARYYDPSRPGFLTMDTWNGKDEKPVTLNKYIYADVDPVNGIDPSGNMTIGGQMAAIGGFAILSTLAIQNIKPLSMDRTTKSNWDGILTDKERGIALLLMMKASFSLWQMAFSNDDERIGVLRVESELERTVQSLRDRDSSTSISVPIPPRKKGWYTCIARAQDLGRSTGGSLRFGWGWGISKDFQLAKRAAIRMANDSIGAIDTHHTQWRCMGPNGGRPLTP